MAKLLGWRFAAGNFGKLLTIARVNHGVQYLGLTAFWTLMTNELHGNLASH